MRGLRGIRLGAAARATLGIALLGLATGCLDSFGPDVVEVERARRTASGPGTSADGIENATEVPLPDIWRISDRQRTPSAWYRARFRLADVPPETWAVYLPRFAQSAEVFLNGERLGSSGRIAPPPSRNWNRPFLVLVPPGVLRAGENAIDVHLALARTAPSFLRPFYVGPERELGPAYRLRYFLQISCARYGAVLMIAVALLLGFIALRREEFRSFRFFTAGCVFWAIATGELFLQDPVIPGRWWQLVAMAAVGLSVLLFLQTTHRAFRRDRRRMEVALYAILAVLIVVLAAAPDAAFERLAFLFWAFCFGTASYLAALFIFAARPRVPRGRALMVLGFVGVTIAVHDVLLAFFVPVPISFFLAPILSLVAAFWGGWVVIDHFLSALRETETLNRELEARVELKHAELEANFERLRELERQRVVGTERERLMREMHDGMGGQLVSALAMAEDGETTPLQIAEVLRGALDDMRMVIDSLDPVIDDVPTLLGMMRGRVEPRLRAHGLRFDWRVTDLPPTPHFGPEQFLHVLRIAQEAITNVVKHAGARVITLATEEASDAGGRPGIVVSIGDDGRGYDAGTRNGGRGLENMRVRARLLRGSVEVIGRPGTGTTVRLWIPMDAGS